VADDKVHIVIEVGTQAVDDDVDEVQSVDDTLQPCVSSSTNAIQKILAVAVYSSNIKSAGSSPTPQCHQGKSPLYTSELKEISELGLVLHSSPSSLQTACSEYWIGKH
jgi:hypothetical protein